MKNLILILVLFLSLKINALTLECYEGDPKEGIYYDLNLDKKLVTSTTIAEAMVDNELSQFLVNKGFDFSEFFFSQLTSVSENKLIIETTFNLNKAFDKAGEIILVYGSELNNDQKIMLTEVMDNIVKEVENNNKEIVDDEGELLTDFKLWKMTINRNNGLTSLYVYPVKQTKEISCLPHKKLF